MSSTPAIEVPKESENTIVQEIPLDGIEPSAANPRQSMDSTALKELADFVSGHKIGLLFRRPFCCCRSGESPGNRRLPFVRGTKRLQRVKPFQEFLIVAPSSCWVG